MKLRNPNLPSAGPQVPIEVRSQGDTSVFTGFSLSIAALDFYLPLTEVPQSFNETQIA